MGISIWGGGNWSLRALIVLFDYSGCASRMVRNGETEDITLPGLQENRSDEGRGFSVLLGPLQAD